ncbi:MAG: A/G-specific adenine glycosylase [Bacteroidota bacterium]|nr:A/G-specific adenine glycosylase [Bacteroidota bacterium]MDP4230266.1 A/G-specific adenine glycosylase [Bacteroidota bacterium]
MSPSPLTLSSRDRKRFAGIEETLIEWYNMNRRKFSWRKKIRDPYEVLVCEVMGQQTQASRIEEFLPRFLHQFPTIESLAAAKQSDVIRAWQGLGYNRRALNLQRAAIALSNKPFPKTEADLLKLPGIGDYTARAILIFAYNKPVATVDVNIERVLSRLFRIMPDSQTMLPKHEILALGEAILPRKRSRLWHEALMDFGATICKKRAPKCGECPLYAKCKSGPVLIDQPATLKNLKVIKERQYFGQPKRIWRGRILKLISMNHGLTEASVLRHLKHSKGDADFKQFVQEVLRALITDGFCIRKSDRKYYLA